MAELDRTITPPTDEDINVAQAALLPKRFTSDGVQICGRLECETPIHARGLCQTHYRTALRLTRTGGRKVPGPAPEPSRVRSRHNVDNPNRLRDTAMYRKQNLKQNYGITVEDYEAMLESQDYKCPICEVDFNEHPRRPHVDHDHATGQVRAVLCDNCNSGIGHMKDNADNLKRAIAYLEYHSNTEEPFSETASL